MIDAGETLPPRFNMAAYCIGRAAAARGGEPALIVVDDAKAARPAEVWTFAQLEDAVLRIARGLREAGLEPGARILIRLDNTSAYALLFFGAIAGGFVPLPTSAQLTEPELRFLLEDSGAASHRRWRQARHRRGHRRRARVRCRRDCAHDRARATRALR